MAEKNKSNWYSLVLIIVIAGIVGALTKNLVYTSIAAVVAGLIGALIYTPKNK